jgi:hypothetical protein
VSKRTKQELSGLSAAIAAGETVAHWAARQQPPIPRRTAYTWSRLPDVRKAVESIRRRCLDRAAGQLARGATAAAAELARLSTAAESEAVRVTACRAVLQEYREVTDYQDLAARVAALEESRESH